MVPYVKVKEIENITYRKPFIQESTKQLSMDNYDHDYENNYRSIIFNLGSKVIWHCSGRGGCSVKCLFTEMATLHAARTPNSFDYGTFKLNVSEQESVFG